MSKYNPLDNSSSILNTGHNLTNIVLENIEKLTSLQLKITRNAVHHFSESFKNLASVNGTQQLFEQANEIVKDNIKTNNNNYQDLISALSDARSELIEATIQHSKSLKKTGSYNLSNFLSQCQKNFNTNKAMDSFVNTANTIYSDANNFANKTASNVKNTANLINKTHSAVHTTAKHAAKPTTQRKPAAKAKPTAQKKPATKAAANTNKVVNESAKTANNSTDKVTEATKQNV